MELCVRLDWPYDEALEEMRAARDTVIAGGPMRLFVGCHREEVVTLGRHAPDSQLVQRAALDARGAVVRRIERGGGATAHGPGQLVAYPVLHMERCGLDVTSLTRGLLEAAADLAREHGVVGTVVLADPPGAGLYVGDRKLASVGFRIEHGVVTHGLALNVVNDLSLFDLIAPCGRAGQPMASLATSTATAAGPSPPPALDQLATRLGFHLARRCVLALTPAQSGWVSSRRVGTGANA